MPQLLAVVRLAFHQWTQLARFRDNFVVTS